MTPDELDDWGFDDISLPAPATVAARASPEPEPEPAAARTIQLTIEDLTAEELDYDDTPAPLEPAIESRARVGARRPAGPGAPLRHPRRRAQHGDLLDPHRRSARIAGLVREIVAASYFATSGGSRPSRSPSRCPTSSAALFADAALSAAFVPVFTELLEQGRKHEAFKLASTLFFLILACSGAIIVCSSSSRRA